MFFYLYFSVFSEAHLNLYGFFLFIYYYFRCCCCFYYYYDYDLLASLVVPQVSTQLIHKIYAKMMDFINNDIEELFVTKIFKGYVSMSRWISYR
jgi:hypothetical protein